MNRTEDVNSGDCHIATVAGIAWDQVAEENGGLTARKFAKAVSPEKLHLGGRLRCLRLLSCGGLGLLGGRLG